MNILKAGLAALSFILAAGYIGINFVAQLPLFLIGENILYAVSYSVLAYMLLRGRRVEPLYLLLTGFNAGRVSRSVITPYGRPGPLAMQHIPLLVLILVAAVLALIASHRRPSA